jgi:hypothetical protein
MLIVDDAKKHLMRNMKMTSISKETLMLLLETIRAYPNLLIFIEQQLHKCLKT